MTKQEKTKTAGTDPIQAFADHLGDRIAKVIVARVESNVDEAIERIGLRASKTLVERLSSALSGPAQEAKPKVTKTSPKPVKQAPAPKVKAVVAPPAPPPPPVAKAKGEKRPSGEVDALAKRLLVVIEKKPGLNMEKLAVEMGLPTKALQLPVGRLFGLNSRGLKVTEPRIRTEGQKRATTYFPVTASDPAAPPAEEEPVSEAAPVAPGETTVEHDEEPAGSD
jgi:hypothetical protein